MGSKVLAHASSCSKITACFRQKKKKQQRVLDLRGFAHAYLPPLTHCAADLLKGPSSLEYAAGIFPRTCYLFPVDPVVLTLGSNPRFSVAGRRLFCKSPRLLPSDRFRQKKKAPAAGAFLTEKRGFEPRRR